MSEIKIIPHYTEPMGIDGELPFGTIVRILMDHKMYGVLGEVVAYSLVNGVVWPKVSYSVEGHRYADYFNPQSFEVVSMGETKANRRADEQAVNGDGE